MANYFGLLKGPQAQNLDKVLVLVGGAALVLPTMLAGITGFALGPVTVQMVVGALLIARGIDWFMK